MKILKNIFHIITNFPLFVRLLIHIYKNDGIEIEKIDYNNHQEIYSKSHDFKEYQFENIVYPEINGKERFFEVALKFDIDEKGQAQNIQIPKEKFYKIRNSEILKKKIKKTTSKKFIEEAKTLIDNYKNWIPFKKDEVFVKTNNIYKRFDFFYHKEYFKKNSDFCLNPDKRPYYRNKEDDLYQRIIKCKYNCDGVMDILCIVEINGKLSNIEAVDARGKIAYEQVVQNLNMLDKWIPALKNGKPIRTQLYLNVYI